MLKKNTEKHRTTPKGPEGTPNIQPTEKALWSKLKGIDASENKCLAFLSRWESPGMNMPKTRLLWGHVSLVGTGCVWLLFCGFVRAIYEHGSLEAATAIHPLQTQQHWSPRNLPPDHSSPDYRTALDTKKELGLSVHYWDGVGTQIGRAKFLPAPVLNRRSLMIRAMILNMQAT